MEAQATAAAMQNVDVPVPRLTGDFPKAATGPRLFRAGRARNCDSAAPVNPDRGMAAMLTIAIEGA